MELQRVWVQHRDTKDTISSSLGRLIGFVIMYQNPSGDVSEQDSYGSKRLEYPIAKIVLDDGRIIYGNEVWWGRLENR